MQTVYAQMGISLDGHVAGPNNGPGNIGGDGWERLHAWVFELAAWRERLGMEGGRTDGDNDRVARTFARNGAVVMGRTMFDHGEEPWGPNPPFRCPVFVVTHRDREPLVRDGGTTFTFMTDGIERAWSGLAPPPATRTSRSPAAATSCSSTCSPGSSTSWSSTSRRRSWAADNGCSTGASWPAWAWSPPRSRARRA